MSTSSLAALPIRRLVPADRAACTDLSEDLGWQREERKWSLLLNAGTGYGIDDPHGGLLAACVLTSYGPLDRPLDERQNGGSEGGPGEGWERRQGFGQGEPDQGLGAIGMMLVAERYARQGVGRRLMRHVIDTAGTIPLTLYATSNGRPLYEQLGFKPIGRAETVRGHFVVPAQAPDGTADPEPARAVRPATADDLPAILRLDSRVFGVDRTHMITRLPAFADHLHVAESDGGIIGYAASWPTTGSQVIGPLIAQDVPTAKALIASLAARTDRVLRTDIDDRHTELLTWLKKHGLGAVSVNTVMTYGTTVLPGDATRNFLPLTVATG